MYLCDTVRSGNPSNHHSYGLFDMFDRSSKFYTLKPAYLDSTSTTTAASSGARVSTSTTSSTTANLSLITSSTTSNSFPTTPPTAASPIFRLPHLLADPPQRLHSPVAHLRGSDVAARWTVNIKLSSASVLYPHTETHVYSVSSQAE